MVEPMQVDPNGISEQETPAESTRESSVRADDTPESTEVSACSFLLFANCFRTVLYMYDLFL
jgi:hypothetical protein